MSKVFSNLLTAEFYISVISSLTHMHVFMTSVCSAGEHGGLLLPRQRVGGGVPGADQRCLAGQSQAALQKVTVRCCCWPFSLLLPVLAVNQDRTSALGVTICHPVGPSRWLAGWGGGCFVIGCHRLTSGMLEWLEKSPRCHWFNAGITQRSARLVDVRSASWRRCNEEERKINSHGS